MMDNQYKKVAARPIIDKRRPKMKTKKGVSLNVENSTREELEKELGIIDINTKFSLNEEQSMKLRESIDKNGNNLLARCAYSGKLENLKLLLSCAVIDVTGRNNAGKTAADIALEGKNYECLLALLKEDSPFPDLSNLEIEITGHDKLKEFIEEREKLHEKIRQGDLESVKEITEGQDSRFLLSPKNVSAMYTAFSSKKWEIYAYLQYVGATFKPEDPKISQEEVPPEDQEQMNVCLEEYFMESHDAHIYKLLGSTKYVQKYRYDLQIKVESLYRKLDKFGSSALLMKILTYQDVDIVFDFEKTNVDRLLYCKYPSIGIADSYSLRAYVAANPFENEKDEKKVASVLAHELCHLVMQKIFKNNCNPYRKDEKHKKEEFESILQNIKSELDKEPCQVGEKYDILAQIFIYEECDRHSELISRVYELIILGEEMTLRKEFEPLYRFYRDIVDICQNYLKHKNKFLKHVNLCQSLQMTVGILPKLQSMYETLRVEEELDLDQWMERNNQTSSSTLTLKTSVPDLTCMSLYVYLRRYFKNHFSKQCIFISVNNFLKHKDVILAAFRCKACCYLVLVSSRGQREKKVDDLIEGQISEGKRVVLIESVPVGEENTYLSYDWNKLPEKITKSLMNKDIDFQGKNMKFKDLVTSEISSEIIHHDELIGLIQKKVEIGSKYYSEDLPEYFIERKLQKVFSSDENENPHFCCDKLLEETKDIIVSDAFGSGKRTLLTYIMKTIKKDDPRLWLVRLKCQEYVQTPMEQNAVSHLLETLKIIGTLEGSCLKKLLTIKGRVKIFFDGHQKLKEQDQILFLEMVEKLKQETQSQFWFFTIPEYSSALTKLDIKLAFRICKLEKEQQVKLLNEYRKHKRPHETDTQNVKRFKSSHDTNTLNLKSVDGMKSSPLDETPAEKILEYFSPEFDNLAKELNMLILLADAFNDADRNSNKFDILSKVVHKKISMIFHKQEVVDDAIRKPLLELYHNEHENIAAKSIKHGSMPSDAYPYNNVHAVRDYIHHIGLVSPGNFQFLHPIIRDYFCVEWLNKTIERDFPMNSKEGDNWKTFRSLLIQKLQSAMRDA